jgi:hypothetical protein
VFTLRHLRLLKSCGTPLEILLTAAENRATLRSHRKVIHTFHREIHRQGANMAVVVKSIAQSSTKWVARTGVAAGDYAAGVANSPKDQAALAAAAEGNWSAGVQAAATNHTFAKNVSAAGTGAWKAGVAAKGAGRYAPGTAAAAPKYTSKFGPFLNVIAGLDLGARYPRGDPRNQARSTMVQVALNKARIGH